MKRFQTYLVGKRIMPEKRVPYYVSWVSRFYAFCNKSPGDNVSASEIEQFLMHLSKSCEKLRIRQTKEADALYRFIHCKSAEAENADRMGADRRWKQVADETVRFPFFP